MNRKSSSQPSHTLIERLGFRDDDLQTPDHDRIMLWLDEFALQISCHLIGIETRFDWDNLSAIDRACLGEPSHPSPRCKATWEWPVGNERYVAGFIDLHAAITWGTSLSIHRDFDLNGEPANEWRVRWKTVDLAYEVKTKIPSLGALLREISFYKARGVKAHFVVVSPEGEQWIDRLNAQGVSFVHTTVDGHVSYHSAYNSGVA